MDLFQMARVDKNVSIEDTMRTLIKLRDEGHFKDIGLSEVSAETINRAVKVAPIAAVEVE
jgi:pyridoxine 4-dehydrogenase